MKSRNGKRVSHSNQLHVFISKHTNYVLWPLMSHGTDCRTLASLSLSEPIRLLLSLLYVGGILYTVLHLSNTHKHMHTFMYLCTDNNNQSHVQQHEKGSKLKSIGTHSVTHFLPTSIVFILSVVFFNVSVNCLSPGTITERERRLLNMQTSFIFKLFQKA